MNRTLHHPVDFQRIGQNLMAEKTYDIIILSFKERSTDYCYEKQHINPGKTV